MNIFIAVLSLVLLITLHELGHFLVAKKFDVKVEEFGIGIPPRVAGKKIGETIYSINLIPLGGFVRMMGEEERVEDERSFSEKPIWQRALVIVAGVASFWLLAILIFAITSFSFGVLTQVEDEVDLEESFVMVGLVNEEGFEEELEEIRPEDRVHKVNGEEITRVEQLETALKEERTEVTFLSGDEQITIDFSDRDPVEVMEALDARRFTREKFGPLESLRFGASHTGTVSYMQVAGLSMALRSFITGEELPEGMEFGGPVMIGDMATDALARGPGDYLMFVGVIATILAVMNILPIPALDGGRLLFLIIEKIKGGPIPKKAEVYVNGFFFILLVSIMVLITIRDIFKLL